MQAVFKQTEAKISEPAFENLALSKEDLKDLSLLFGLLDTRILEEEMERGSVTAPANCPEAASNEDKKKDLQELEALYQKYEQAEQTLNEESRKTLKEIKTVIDKLKEELKL